MKGKYGRKALNDSQFIEYLYNRAYALLYLLRLKDNNKEKQLEEKECILASKEIEFENV